MCDAIYIGNTQQTFKKYLMVIYIIYHVYSNKGKKSDSSAAHFIQQFNNTTSRTDLGKCMTFKVIK